MNYVSIRINSFLFVAGLFANSVLAQTLYWDPGLTSSSSGGGTGTWSSAANWFNGTADTTWVSGDIASFGGTAGTVTLGAAETAGGMTFTSTGYTVSGPSANVLTLSGAPTFTVPSGGTATIISDLSDGGSGNPFTVSGPGTLVFSGTNSYSGGTTVSPGSTFEVNNLAGTAVGDAGSGPIALGANSTFIFNGHVQNGLMQNVITGGANTTFEAIVNSGANIYYDGSLANFYGTILITNSPGAGNDLGLNAAGTANAAPYTMPATAGGVYICSNQVLFLNGADTFAPPIVINGGTPTYGTLRIDVPVTVSGPVLLNGNATNNCIGSVQVGTATISGVISDNGHGYGLLRWGGGSTAQGNIIALSGQNTYSGPTTLGYGKLQVAAPENPGVSGPLGVNNLIYFNPQGTKVDAATLMYSSANNYDYSSRFSTAPNQPIKVDLFGQTVSFATPMSSSGGSFLLFDTSGAPGTLTFNAANTYTGSTTLSNATVVANVAGAIPAAGALTVGSGTLIAAVANAIPGSVTVSGTGTLIANVANSVQGNITLNNSSTLTISNSSALSQFATLTVNSGGVNLNFAGTQNISALYFGTSLQATGTWGAVGSSAANQSGVFSGNGILNVVVPAFVNAYWDPNALHGSPGSGGSGTWNSSLADWWETNASDTAWSPAFIANFAGSAGTVTLAASETTPGLVFTTSGYTITNSAGSVLTLTGAPTVSVGGTATIGCPIAGTAGLNQTGSGTLILTATNTYSGMTTINGALAVSGKGQLGGGNYVPNIVDGGTFIYGSSAPQTLGGVISDNSISGIDGTLIQQGTGLLTLSGANTYSIGTFLGSNSAIRVTSATGVSSGPVTLSNNAALTWDVQAGGIININNQVIGTNNSVVDFTQVSSYYLGGDWSQFYGTVNLVASSGGGIVEINAGSPTFNIPASATWNVATGGSLVLGNKGGSDVMNATVILHGAGGVSWGALRMDGFETQAGNVLLAGTNNWIGSYNAYAATISGNIMDYGSGNGVVITARSGDPVDRIIFAGSNTYTGTTTISNGILQVDSAETPGVSGPLGTSKIYFPTGFPGNPGTLQFSPANNYDYSGRFSSAANQQFTIDVNGEAVNFASPLVSAGGNLTLEDSSGGGTLTLNAASTYNGGTTVNSGTLDIGPSGSIMGNVTLNNGALELDNNKALATGATLNLVGGGPVNLNYAGTQYVNALIVGGDQETNGVYGANGNNPSGLLTGTGTITVGPPLTISSASIVNHQFSVSWVSITGLGYNVYTSTNLTQPWTLITPTPITATGPTTSFTVPGSTATNAQLYVLIQQ